MVTCPLLVLLPGCACALGGGGTARSLYTMRGEFMRAHQTLADGRGCRALLESHAEGAMPPQSKGGSGGKQR